MVDLLEQVILPAFLDTSQRRTYDDVTYLLLDTSVQFLDEVPCVVGRFVKDTIIERTQILDPEKGLITSEQKLESAESSLFVLTLDTHKLIYLHETQGAPGFGAFRTTMERFLRSKHDQFIRAWKTSLDEAEAARIEKETANAAETGALIPKAEKFTLKSLRDEYPTPTLEVIALSTYQSLEEFIGRFSKLNRVKVTLVTTNHELDDLDAFWKKVREAKDDAGSTKSTLTHASADGLNKTNTFEQLKAVMTQGNALSYLSGKDDHNMPLEGDEDKFKLRLPQVDLPPRDDIMGRVSHVFKAFQAVLESGNIILQAVPEATQDLLRGIFKQSESGDK